MVKPTSRDFEIFFNDVASEPVAIVFDRGNHCQANAHVRVEHPVARLGHGQDQPLDQFHRELTGVDGLFNVVVLDVRKYPYVSGIIAVWVAGKLAPFRPFEIFIVRVFRGHPDRVKIECVVVSLGKPHYGFVAPR